MHLFLCKTVKLKTAKFLIIYKDVAFFKQENF